MRILLDSHVLVWAMAEPERLSPTARTCLSEGRDDIFLSLVTPWELTIKAAKGLFRFDQNIAGFLSLAREALGFTWLDIKLAHIHGLETLPPHHSDPFDRLLIAQAAAEGLVILSADRSFSRYAVPLIW